MNTFNNSNNYLNSKNTSANKPESIFWVIEYVWKKVRKIIEKEIHTYKIDNNAVTHETSIDEFENYILDKLINNNWNIEKLDFTHLDDFRKYQWYLYQIIWKNHPLLEILRLTDEQKVVNITFWWIKKNKWCIL